MSRRGWVAAGIVLAVVAASIGGWRWSQGNRPAVLGVKLEPPTSPVHLRFPELRVAPGVSMRTTHPAPGTRDALELGLSRFIPAPLARVTIPEPGATPNIRAAAKKTPVPVKTSTPTPVPTQAPTPVPTAAPTPAGTATPAVLTETFAAYPLDTPWLDGSTYGTWLARYNGYGQTAVVAEDDATLEEAPAVSTDAGDTHASMVTSSTTFGDIDLRARMRTVSQLRTGSTPNPWEVAWLIWHHTSDGAFYYFVPKPNGWELGKVDTSRLDPAGPDCVWPAYLNCSYPGGQRFLATGSSPSYPVGPWLDVRILQRSATMTVSVNGVTLTTFTDGDRPYTNGAIAFYNEDARVRLDTATVYRP